MCRLDERLAVVRLHVELQVRGLRHSYEQMMGPLHGSPGAERDRERPGRRVGGDSIPCCMQFRHRHVTRHARIARFARAVDLHRDRCRRSEEDILDVVHAGINDDRHCHNEFATQQDSADS